MEARDEDVGGLVEQSRTRKGLPGCSHAKGNRIQHEEQLEEYEDMPTREMTEFNLSEEKAEQQLSGETA
jgi:hypothetical protein